MSNITKFINVLESMPKHLKVFQNLRKSEKVSQNITKYVIIKYVKAEAMSQNLQRNVKKLRKCVKT